MDFTQASDLDGGQDGGQDSLSLSPYLPLSFLSSRPCILSQNMRSFNKNFAGLKDLLTRCKGATLIALQELWNTNYARPMQGYQKLISTNRVKKGGGGVGFLIQNNINYTIEHIEGKFESIPITFLFNGQKTRVCNVYNPPGGTNNNFFEYC
jgi:exonuclease III